MVRACPRAIALTAMVVTCLSITARAADSILTLACQGTVTGTATEAKREPISMGVIVNFTARTVQGFAYPAEITTMDDVRVIFARSTNPTIDGTIDRVTGELQATSVMLSRDNKVILAMTYLLKCTPAQRMF
jgi:hypothetical protein